MFFVQSVLEAERCYSQRTEALVHASSMYKMLKRLKLIQQGQPGIGPLCALVTALEPYQADSKLSKDDLLAMEAEILSCAFDKL